MSSLPVELFATSHDGCFQDWILDFGALFYVTAIGMVLKLRQWKEWLH